jgi:carbon-monoxide dehydrogenase medium subunit
MSIIYYSTLPPLKDYFRPATVESAVSLLNRYGNEAKIIAGGTDVLVAMRSRKLAPSYLLDITGIQGLDYILEDNRGGIKIGALATVHSVELSKLIRKKYPLLYEAAHFMGNIQANNLATVAGNVCRASPSGDMACPLLALGASVQIAGFNRRHTVHLDQFSTGSEQTILKKDEIVTEIQVPGLPPGSGTCFLRTSRVASDLAKVNVSVVLTLKDGICTGTRIVLGSVAPTLMRALEAEELIKGKRLNEGLIEKSAQAAAAAAHPRTGSLRASPDYKKVLARTLTRQALTTAFERAGQGGGK